MVDDKVGVTCCVELEYMIFDVRCTFFRIVLRHAGAVRKREMYWVDKNQKLL